MRSFASWAGHSYHFPFSLELSDDQRRLTEVTHLVRKLNWSSLLCCHYPSLMLFYSSGCCARSLLQWESVSLTYPLTVAGRRLD